MSDEDRAKITTAYTELCNSYHRIDDFRSKLLGFLPLATGGIFLLAGDSGKNILPDSMAIGLFGFVVALGLFAFEIYGIRKCTIIIALGRHLESELGVAGQFTHRPAGLQAVANSASPFPYARYISEPIAAGIIYPAVAAAWLYLALRHPPLGHAFASAFALAVFVAGFVASYKYVRWLECDAKDFDKILQQPKEPEGQPVTATLVAHASLEGSQLKG